MSLNLYQKQPPEMFCNKGVLRNFAKFTGKHLCQSIFFNKVAGLRPATLLKKKLWHRCFPVNFAKFLRTPFLTEHLRWLFLLYYTFYAYDFFPMILSTRNKAFQSNPSKKYYPFIILF